jgi:hypothetical protein
MHLLRLIAILVMTLFVTAPAVAGDWVVTRLRGTVEQLVDEVWVPLKRGDSVEYERYIRTLSDGHAELQRSLEVLTLDVNTTIRIELDPDTGFTTVLQDTGRLEVEADVQRVQHFAVKTPYLAAVVKGTHFVVTTDLEGATVEVDRGAVEVSSVATERSTTIGVGQSATVRKKNDLVIGGLGPWPAIVEKRAPTTAPAASLGSGGTGGAGGAVPLETATDISGTQVAAAPMTQIGGGAVGDLMAAPAPAAEAEPARPVSITVVLIGALLGAALGALALFLRRAIH